MATIRQRGDRWQAIVKRKGYPQRSRTFDLKKDAEKWARLEERAMDAGAWVDQTPAKQTTLAELLERYEREVTATKRGAATERYRLAMFKRSTLAPLAVGLITGSRIAEWRDSRLKGDDKRKGVSTGTALRELATLAHVFSVAIKEWEIPLPCNPVEQIRKPPPGKARDRVLTDDQRAKLLHECGRSRVTWLKPVVMFALETGARRGEILGLKWADVDLQRATARLDGKTGARVVPLSPACVETLKGLPRSLAGLVFPAATHSIKHSYLRAVARAGIDDWTFHDLRHDALTRLAKRGLSVLELRAISGHSTANMLQRYVNIDPAELARKLG